MGFDKAVPRETGKMNLDLKNLKVLVTGSSKGLGAATVQAFLKEGASVAMCSSSIKNLTDASKKMDRSNGCLFYFQVDATDENSVRTCVRESANRMGGIDVLVNNVGGTYKFAHFFDLTAQDWSDNYKLNVMSMVYFSKEAHPYLNNSNKARIINISSITGLQPGGFNPHYSVCKAATINLNKHLANIFAKDGILVNCIAPGPFDSDTWNRYVRMLAEEPQMDLREIREEEIRKAGESILLKRIGTFDDIVPLILFLSSSASQWTTGSCIVIDGGKMRTI